MRNAPMVFGFLDHMRRVPDHRIPGMTTYPLDQILLAVLVGVVCGADDWECVEAVAERSLDWLRGFLPFAEGVPTAQTFRKGLSPYRRTRARVKRPSGRQRP